MVRLIDADAFVKEYSQISEKFRNNEIMRMMIDHFIDAVKTFPTAYDVDKVEQQIEEMFGVDAAYYGTEVKWAVDKAREIVRKGCVKNE